MPNMDDIAYFESAPYQYRGGIWSDASRLKKQRSHSPTSSGSSQTVSPPLTTASEPILPADPSLIGITRHDNNESLPNLVAPIGTDKGIPVKEQLEPGESPFLSVDLICSYVRLLTQNVLDQNLSRLMNNGAGRLKSILWRKSPLTT
jgi:hypothetical protein